MQDVTSQSRNCFKTIEAVLEEAGFAMADIVRATYYITDGKDADAHFAVCGEVLGDIRPAATLLVVVGLYKPEMKIEIDSLCVTRKPCCAVGVGVHERTRVPAPGCSR